MNHRTSPRSVTTLRAPIRLRNAREHARLARRLREGAELHNALATFDRGIRRHNRRCFLRHAPEWGPGADDWQDVRAGPADPDKLVCYPTYFDCTRLLQEARRELAAITPDDPLLTDWTSKEPNAVAHDYLRCRGTPARTGRFRRSLRSLTSRVCLRHAAAGRALRVHIGPAKRQRNALRAVLPRPLEEGERIRSIRIVQVQEGHARVCPSPWEAHVGVEGPARPALPRRARPRAIGLDVGGRRIATRDTGTVLAPVPAPSAAKAHGRALSRKRRGSNARRRVRARLRQQAARHAGRRQQKLTKHAAILAREHAIVVVENLDQRAMRARGGQRKRGVNRTLAEASPGAFIHVLRRKLNEAGRWLVAVPAPYTSRQCVACGSRQTTLTRTRVQCGACGTTHDRDHAAAATILLRGIATQSSQTTHDSGPSGSAETARRRRLPASECWRAHRASLARDPAGTRSERLRDRALRGLAQERWGQSPPEHRSDSSCEPTHATVSRIGQDSRQLMRGAARH